MAGAEVVLHGAIVLCPMALGGAPAWLVLPLAALSSLALALVLLGARVERGMPVTVAALVPLATAALCLVQLVPLPAGLLEVASPFNATLRDFSLMPLGFTSNRPITVDPPATWRELAKALSYAFLAIAAARVSASRRARRRLGANVALTGVVLVAIGFVHWLVHAEQLFGLHTFTFVPGVMTPFANVNHLAAFLTLSTLVALGLGLSQRERGPQIAWVAAAFVCAVGAFESNSRGGAAFLIVGTALFALLEWRRRVAQNEQPQGARRAVALIPAAVVCTLIGVGAFVTWESLGPRMDTLSSVEKLHHTKMELWPVMARGALDFWRFGMGRGAYELAATRFQAEQAEVIFTHPENIALQVVSEVGLPLGIAMVLLGALVLWRLAKQTSQGALEVGLFAAVAAVVLHDCFDFALELPAPAVAAAVLSGAALASTPSAVRLPFKAAVPAGVLVAALAVLAAVMSRPDFHDSEHDIEQRIAAGAPASEIEARVREAVDRHPADYVLYVLAARVQASDLASAPVALAWVNRALFLRPIDTESHKWAARALMRLGRRSQAFLEYRLAADYESLFEGVRRAKTVDELEILSSTPAQRMGIVGEAMRQGRLADAEALAERGLDPSNPETLPLYLVKASLAVGRQDLEGAERTLAAAPAREGDSELRRAQANLLVGKGKREEAAVVLRELAVKHPEDAGLAFELARLLISMNHLREARDALSRVGPFITSQQVRAEKMVIEGSTFEAERSWARAVSSYKSAARLAANWPDPHFRAAGVYERMGKFDDAQHEVYAGVEASGRAMTPDEAQWVDRLRKSESQAHE
jgi:tetratricopeptide (TPR) repeat protein